MFAKLIISPFSYKYSQNILFVFILHNSLSGIVVSSVLEIQNIISDNEKNKLNI